MDDYSALLRGPALTACGYHACLLYTSLIALAESEADLRLFAGMQFLTLIALLGLERYPCLLYTSRRSRAVRAKVRKRAALRP